MDPLERLQVLINSNTPIVIVETVEEGRAVALIRAACSAMNLPLFEWSIADGLQRSTTSAAHKREMDSRARMAEFQSALSRSDNPAVDFSSLAPGTSPGGAIGPEATGTILNTKDPAGVLAHIATMTVEAVFILKDFHRHLNDAIVVRRLRDAAQAMSSSRRALVLTGPSIELPPELQKEVEYLDLPLPDKRRLRQIIEEAYSRLSKSFTIKRTADDKQLDELAANLSGLTEDEAERAVAQALVTRYALAPEIVTDVMAAKKDILRRADMLEFIEGSLDMAAIGGLDNLKKWLTRRRGAFEPGAREFGLEPPRGVIIMGVQGCGKSLCARAVAGEWKLPLVRLDTSAIFDKYIGETEKRVQKLFRVAEQLAPVVLWVDELEKVFAGSGPDSASVDAGVSSRLLGSFLSWMQDRKQPVFIAATCNNVHVLPPELMRKGRFDEIFFVDLPNRAERRAILALHLARRKRDPKQFDLGRLVEASQGFSGAEIDAAIQGAMYASFADKQPMSTETIVQELRATVPLSHTRAEDIAALRAWARERAVPASVPDTAGKSE